MNPSIIPDRLKNIESNHIIEAIEYKVQSKCKVNIKPNEPKSVFGKVLKNILNQESTKEERFYIYKIWKAYDKENVCSEVCSKKWSKVDRTRRYKKHIYNGNKSESTCYVAISKQQKRPRSKGLEFETSNPKRPNADLNKNDECVSSSSINSIDKLEHDVTLSKEERRAKKIYDKTVVRIKTKNERKKVKQDAKALRDSVRSQKKRNFLHRAVRWLPWKKPTNNAANLKPSASPNDDTDNELLSINTPPHNATLTNTPDSSGSNIEPAVRNETPPIIEGRLKDIIWKYNQDINIFPTFCCPVCKRFVYSTNAQTKRYTFTDKMISQLNHHKFYEFQPGVSMKMCRRCADHMSRNKIPPMYYQNNMETQPTPDVLSKLNEIETRLISQVKIFMKIFHLCKGRAQLAMKGSCVHFPQSVDEIIEKLPLNPATADVVIVNETDQQGKHLDDYKVRGKLLFEALQYLKANNHLYRNVDVQDIDEASLQVAEMAEKVDNANAENIAVRNHVMSQPAEGYKELDARRYILRANIHQGSPNAFPTGGNQCTAICATLLAHATINPINVWTSQDLDNIIFDGDRYYAAIVPDRDRYLTAEETNGIITCFGAVQVNCQVEVDNTFFGVINKVPILPGEHLRKLPESIAEFIESQFTYAILTTNDFSMGLIKLDNHVYFFDPHSRGPRGWTAANGSACILKYNADIAPREISTLVHRNVASNLTFKHDLPFNILQRFHYNITPVICTVIQENNVGDDELNNISASQDLQQSNENGPHENHSSFQHNNGNHSHVNNNESELPANEPPKIPEIPIQSLRNPNHAMLDCVIRSDEPNEPTVNAYLNACRKNEDVIPAVPLCRERGRPMYPEKEKRLEELAFVKAFPNGRNGLSEDRTIPIYTLDYFQQGVMGNNLAFHSNEYLFYALNRVEAHTLHQKIAVCGNMAANNGEGNADDSEHLPGLSNVHLYMQGIRGSLYYWKHYMGNVLSMIESLGIPTFFLTISYDDLNSLDALTALWKAKYGPNAELARDPKDMPYEERKELLNNHPVAAARHFSQKLNVIMSLIRNEGEFLFGRKVVDFTYRVEFQARGSPHIHALLWLENPPDYNTEEGKRFIEQNISCSLKKSMEELVLKYQNHRHSHTCFKKHNVCRFGFPRKPSAETKILDEEEIQKNHGRFLELKRTQDEIMINNYHPKLLQILKCNMDIQLVTGCKAIAYYIGKYMSKGEPTYLRDEISNIITTFKTDTKSSYYEKAKKIANAIIKEREISGQECAFRLCHLLLRNSSRGFVFIPTYRPANRLRLVRKDTVLSKEPQLGMNIIERYMKRPTELNNLCLLEFASWWKPRPSKFNALDEEIVENEETNEDDGITAQMSLQENKGIIQKRRRHAVVRYPRFQQLNQLDDYLYSMMLLYKPFRDESEIFDQAVHGSLSSAFEINKHHFRTHLDSEIINPDLADQIDAVMLQLNSEERQDDEERLVDGDRDEENGMFYEEVREIIDENEIFAVQQDVNDLPLLERVQRLNSEQRSIYNTIFDKIRNQNPRQLLQFTQGGAGVGKSYLIKCISDMVTSIHPSKERAIIKAAPTGVAARNITGVTLHKAFSLGVEQHGLARYLKLGGKTLHEKRKIFRFVILIIIDEVSMISYNVIRMIHLRLCEIFGVDEPFGNIHVLLFGDLLQIEPVRGTWCFQQPAHFSHETNLWSLFTFTELYTPMRQDESSELYELLQRLRIGTLTWIDMDMLKERLLSPEHPNHINLSNESKNSLHLYPKVRQVDAYNTLRLEDMQRAGVLIYKIEADDRFATGMKYRNKVPKDLIYKDMRKCAGIPSTLELGVGTRVMLKWNIEPISGLCNGSIGTVRGFKWAGLRRQPLHDGEIPESVFVEFDNGINPRLLSKQAGFSHCVEIKEREFEFTAKRGNKVSRRQIPLVPSFACSIHKSQGLSLDKCTVHLGKHLFRPGLAYVACSRVKTWEGLYITDIDERKLLVNKNGRGPCNEAPLKELYRLKMKKLFDGEEENISSELFDELLKWSLEYVMCDDCRNWRCICTCN